MKIYKLLIFSLIIIILASCSSLSQKLQNLLESKSTKNSNEIKVAKNYCDSKSNIQSLLEDPLLLSSTQFKNNSISFIEKSILLSLFEMERRPDITGPYSRLQVIVRTNGEMQYFDFRPKNLEDDSKISYLYGLQYLLRKYKSTTSLTELTKRLEIITPDHLPVSAGFESFLSQYKKDIKKNKELEKLYMKGDEILTKFETFQRANLIKSIQSFQKKKLFDDSSYEVIKNGLDFTTTDAQKNTTSCNFSFNKNIVSSDQLSFDGAYSSNSFSYVENNNYFLAVTSSHLKNPIEMKDEFFINARPMASPLPICHLKNTSLKTELSLTSSTGRIPSQHIKHLLEYDLMNSLSLDSISHTLNFARHLFLINPDRILYESKKGRKEQLNFFLQMNFPIYHVENIGEITAIATQHSNHLFSIIKDDRTSKKLICIP